VKNHSLAFLMSQSTIKAARGGGDVIPGYPNGTVVFPDQTRQGTDNEAHSGHCRNQYDDLK